MVSYDASLLYQFADRLYSRANQAIATSTVVGVLIGAAAGYFVNRAFDLYALLGALVAGAIGYSIGAERAFQLKLQAQTALCHVKIEENTRKA